LASPAIGLTKIPEAGLLINISGDAMGVIVTSSDNSHLRLLDSVGIGQDNMVARAANEVPPKPTFHSNNQKTHTS
jgi:hypothetical protein